MSENFEQYKARNTPSHQNTAPTASSPGEAVAMHGNWIPWPRKDLAKGGKSPTKMKGKMGIPKMGKKKKY